MQRQSVLDDPVEDAVPLDGIGDHVPALIGRRWHPDGDHRMVKPVHEKRLQVATWLVPRGRTTRAWIRGGAAQPKAPPETVGWPIEQAQPEVAIRWAEAARK